MLLMEQTGGKFTYLFKSQKQQATPCTKMYSVVFDHPRSVCTCNEKLCFITTFDYLNGWKDLHASRYLFSQNKSRIKFLAKLYAPSSKPGIKTRTADWGYGLGMKYGLRYIMQTADQMWPADCRLGIKHWQGYKTPAKWSRCMKGMVFSHLKCHFVKLCMCYYPIMAGIGGKSCDCFTYYVFFSCRVSISKIAKLW